MSGKPSESGPNKLWESVEFKRRFEKIIARPLEVGNIDSYFDQVINDLVQLTQDIRDRYVVHNSEQRDLTPRQEEDNALEFFELDTIHVDEYLTEAMRRRELVLEAGDELTDILTSEVVSTPPDKAETQRWPGAGSFVETTTRNHVLSLLYILHSLGIKIDPTESAKGSVLPHMMRRKGYVTLVIPGLNRVAQVCDESNNRTFIFDLKRLREIGIDVSMLETMKKSEKESLIKDNKGVGTFLDNSIRWITRVERLLVSEQLEAPEEIRVRTPSPGRENLPKVSDRDVDPWKGFWTDEKGKHWGPVSGMLDMLLRKHEIVFGKGSLYAAIGKTGDELLPRKKVIDLSGHEADMVCFEDLETMDFVQRASSVSRVEKKGEWEGFVYDEKTGMHIGSAMNIALRMGLEKRVGSVAYLASEMVAAGEIVEEDLRNPSGKYAGGYPFEIVQKKIEELLKLPHADEVGPWKKYLYDESVGEHFGSNKRLSKTLDIDFAVIERAIEELKLEGRKFRVRGFLTTTGYSYEKIVQHPDIAERLQLQNLGRVAEKKGDWAYYYTDPSGIHWGTIHAISKKLNDQNLGRSVRWIQKNAGTSIRVISKGGPTDAYSLEQILEKVQQK